MKRATSSAYNETRCFTRSVAKRLEKRLLISLPNQGVQHIHDEDEEHGRQWAPLAKSLPMSDPLPQLSIEQYRVEAERSRQQTISRQRLPKPKWDMTSRRNGQEIESKAFVMSSLSRRRGSLRLCKNLAIYCTRRKLSWMHLPRTNALWLVETKEFSLGAKRLARILVTSLAKLCTRLIGRKSFTSTASGFFGMRIRNAELRGATSSHPPPESLVAPP